MCRRSACPTGRAIGSSLVAGPGGRWRFVNEMTVEQSTKGSYFMACGFANGLLSASRNWVMVKRSSSFPCGNPGNPQDLGAKQDKVPEQQRVEVLHTDADVKVERFGGEGTGGKSMWPFDWKTGESYRFCVRSQVEGSKSAFRRLLLAGRGESLEAPRDLPHDQRAAGRLRGFYSFVEDFPPRRQQRE